MTGGTTRAVTPRARAASRTASGARRGGNETMVAVVVVGAADTVSDLSTGMFINVRLRISPAGAPAVRARYSSDFDALDREILEIRSRVFRIEDFAVEQGLLAARRRSRDFRCR